MKVLVLRISVMKLYGNMIDSDQFQAYLGEHVDQGKYDVLPPFGACCCFILFCNGIKPMSAQEQDWYKHVKVLPLVLFFIILLNLQKKKKIISETKSVFLHSSRVW